MDVVSSKKVTAKAMKSFESRMNKSLNDLERSLILLDMKKIIQNEIDLWFEKIALMDTNEVENQENVLVEASKHVAGLEETMEKINEFLEMFKIKATKLADVLAREGKLPDGAEVFTSSFEKLNSRYEN